MCAQKSVCRDQKVLFANVLGHLAEQVLDLALAQERDFERRFDFPASGVSKLDSMVADRNEQSQLFGCKLDEALAHGRLRVQLNSCDVLRAFLEKIDQAVESALVPLPCIDNETNSIVALRRGGEDLYSVSANLTGRQLGEM
jgi:hypothetical protein